MSRLSIIRYLAQGFTVSFNINKGVNVIAPTIQKKLKGPFDIQFYRLQQKQIEHYIQSSIEFQWTHPNNILEDEYGVIWYYQKEMGVFWRPTEADLIQTTSITKNNWLYIDFNKNKYLKHLKQGTPIYHHYPSFKLIQEE